MKLDGRKKVRELEKKKGRIREERKTAHCITLSLY